MSAEKITAETRTEFGKGAARRIRRDNKIPAVIYGHGNDPMHMTLPGHDTMMALKQGRQRPAQLDIDGNEQLALAKDVQGDPISRVIEHIDLVAVRRGEKVTVDVPSTSWARPPPRPWSSPRTPPSRSRPRPPTSPSSSRSPSRASPPAPRSSPGELELPEGRPSWSTPRRWSSTSPRQVPPRSSRPSWPRPRPRPASSTRPPTRSRGCRGRGRRPPRASAAGEAAGRDEA